MIGLMLRFFQILRGLPIEDPSRDRHDIAEDLQVRQRPGTQEDRLDEDDGGLVHVRELTQTPAT